MGSVQYFFVGPYTVLHVIDQNFGKEVIGVEVKTVLTVVREMKQEKNDGNLWTVQRNTCPGVGRRSKATDYVVTPFVFPLINIHCISETFISVSVKRTWVLRVGTFFFLNG